MGGAFGNTCRFESGIEAVHTEITFYRFAVIGILYWNIPWTCLPAGHATDTFFLVDVDDTVGTLDHGIGWADRHTQRIVTVAAGAEGDLGSRHPTDHFQGRTADVTEERANRQILVDLAMNLTAMTGYTPF
jgi:hypothetical protein